MNVKKKPESVMRHSHQGMVSLARRIRSSVFELCVARKGHLASSLSCIDILVALYFSGALELSPERQNDRGRDKFILSKGHAEAALYTVLAEAGFFSMENLWENYRSGSFLFGGHPDIKISGVEATSGALGHGLGIMCGFALAAKLDNLQSRHVVLMGDGESMEGTLWETAHLAAVHDLDNLLLIIDKNRISCTDFIEKTAKLDNLSSVFSSLGWNAYSTDGHDVAALTEAISTAFKRPNGRPTLLVAETTKGKGISYMENIPLWHVKLPSTDEELAVARRELNDEAC